jgi:hypothetical protein
VDLDEYEAGGEPQRFRVRTMLRNYRQEVAVMSGTADHQRASLPTSPL